MKTFQLLTVCTLAALAAMASTAAAQHGDAAFEELSIEDAQRVTEAMRPSLVRVAYYLCYDKGEPPGGMDDYGSSYDLFSSVNIPSSGEDLIREERPLELPGYLLGDQIVVTRDVPLHPRFIERIAVRFGEAEAAATPHAYALRHRARFLKLAEPLPGTKALAFDLEAPDPLANVTYAHEGAEWRITVAGSGPSGEVITDELGRQYCYGAMDSLTVDRAGKALAVNLTDTRPLDDSWINLPSSWPALTPAELDALLARVAAVADAALVRAAIHLRSPDADDANDSAWNGGFHMDWTDDAVDENATELHAPGVLVDDRTVLVLQSLPPKITARIESVSVHRDGGDPAAASFAGSLRDWGALLVTLDEPLSGTVALSDLAPADIAATALPATRLIVQGENRTAYHWITRLSAFQRGFRGRLYPVFGAGTQQPFVFDHDGRLVALPVHRRLKVSVKQEYWSGGEAHMLTADALRDILDHRADHVDADNIPLTEQEQRRVAWMGVELQALGQELARLNKVAPVTRDGEIGALVTYVYGDSPAAKQGVEVGDVLARLHVDGEPKPIDINVEDFGGMSFDFADFEGMPAEYLDQLPKPWPSVENQLNRTLTQLGAGRAFTAETYRDGKLRNVALAVEYSPPHYGSADRAKLEGLGLSVRNLTFEVRRFYQKDADAPGIIVARVEPGQKAAVAGIVPYELITHIDGKPVTEVEVFKAVAAGETRIRLTVERMNQARQVVLALE